MKAFLQGGLPADPGLLMFLLVFVAAWCAVAAWQWRPAGRSRQARLAQLPLIDDETRSDR